MTDPRKDLPPVNSPNFLEKVREALGTYLGNRGNALDRGVTLRDLAESGFATLRPNFGSGSGSPIGGPGSLIVDNIVYEPDLTPPPTPTGFTASAAISNLLLECDPQTYTQGHGHAKSRLHGVTWSSGPLPVFADAQPITEFQGTVASHATNPSTTWHLWLTWVTVDGEESTSPAGGTNGVVTRTGEDVALLLDALAGEVTSTELHTTLGSRIDLIDGPTTLAGSVAKRILDETNSRVAALLAESSARAAALTTEATNRTNAIQNEAGIRANAILTEALARENGDSTIQSQVNLLTAASSGDLMDLIAAVNTEQTARIAADAAEALSRETLATQMRGAYNGTDIAQITTGLIHSERLARSDADGAIVTSVSTLSATVADNLTTVNSAITSEASTRANADTAEATNRNTLTTKMIGAANPATATLGSLTSGLLYDETSARSTADSTEVTARQLLSSTMLGSIDPTGKTLGNVTSGIIFDERTTRATAVSGLATRTDTLEASVNSGTTGLATKASSASVTSAVATETTARVNAVNALTTSLGTTNTAITSEQDARSTADTALALRATNLEASVNNATTGLASKASVGYVDTAKVDAISAAASASQVLVSSIKVGGNNLMRNSGHWTSSSTPWSSNGSTVSMDATVPWGEYNSMKLVGSGGALAPTIMRLKPNTQYTVSAMVKGSAALAGASDSNLHIQSWTDESSGNVHQEGSVAYSQDITTSWKLVYQTFITPASATLTYCRMYFYPLAAGFTLNVGYVKLEEGNVATDWTPAPEDTDTKISTVNATLVNDYSTTATMNSAISTATTALASTVGSNLSTALTSYRTAASQDTVTATAIANVSARLDSGGDTYQAIANTATSVSTKSATFAQSTTPTATKAGDLWIDTSDSNKLKQWNGGTWVYADDQRIGSTASSVTTLQSQMTGATGSTLLSSIQTEATTRATQTGELYAQYTVKLDVGGLVSGYGIASSGINGPGSAFGIRADRFWVAAPAIVSEDAPTTNLFLGKSYYKPSWDKTLYLTEYTPGVSQSWMTNNQIEAGGVPPPFSPFVIQATPTTINGVNVPAGIYANDAYIKNGTITNAKIANLAVDDAKIATLNVSKLTAGTLKVGSYIESSDYTSGPTGVGYRIDRDAVVLPATSIRGVLTADQINTDGLEIWNADHSQLILASGSALSTQVNAQRPYASGATKSSYINPDADLESTVGWSISTPAASVISFSSTDGHYRAFDAPSGGKCDIYSPKFEVSPSRTYSIETFVYKWAGSTAAHYLLVAFYDAAGAVVYSAGGTWPSEGSYNYWGLINQAPVADGFNKYTTTFGNAAVVKIPATAVTAKIGILGSYTGTGRWSWGSTRVREVITASNASTYISDLAVNTIKLAHNSITRSAVTSGYDTALTSIPVPIGDTFDLFVFIRAVPRSSGYYSSSYTDTIILYIDDVPVMTDQTVMAQTGTNSGSYPGRSLHYSVARSSTSGTASIRVSRSTLGLFTFIGGVPDFVFLSVLGTLK